VRRSAPVAALAALLAHGCGTTPADPGPEADGLRITGQISQPVIAIGTTATITFRLQNLTDAPIVLTFTETCQIHLVIRDAGGPPPGRNAGCSAPGTPLALPPFGEQVMPLQVRGGAPQIMIYPGIPLDRGHYRAYAVLDPANDRHLTLRSPDIVFEVR
jgi:hypothetical protein